MIKKALFLLTSTVFLAACSIMPPLSSSDATSVSSVSTEINGAHRQANSADQRNNAISGTDSSKPTETDKVTRNLLRLGQRALSQNRLLTPEEDNANMYFQIALGRDPGNYQATLGIAAIVDQYLSWALDAANQGNYATAQGYLAKAKFVNKADPSIAEMADRIQQSRTDHKRSAVSVAIQPDSANLFRLPKDLFQMKEEKILAQIQPIIDRVATTQTAIDIRWPNDKEGRLLYQIINSRTPEFRVRAMIHHQARYTVEVK